MEYNQPIFLKHLELIEFVKEMAAVCLPESIHWCNGSDEEYDFICNKLVEAGTFKRLNEERWPNSFACNSDPSDVARVEDKTFICSRRKEDAGPTNNWVDPKEKLVLLFFRQLEGGSHGEVVEKFRNLTYQAIAD